MSTDRFTLLRKRSQRSGSIPVRTAALAARGGADVLEWGKNKARRTLRRQHH